ncbi:MAG: hypothetical protein PUE08_02635 [Eubacteriales bacterium]|nr:hypothetical protein [Eubacteriales bacterium]
MTTCYFPNNEFDSQIWPAETLEKSTDIRDKILSLNCVGQKIKELRFIGFCYSFEDFMMEFIARSQLRKRNLTEEQLREYSKYSNIPDDIEFDRDFEIDRPFLIKFENGDVFEIVCPMASEFRIGMNSIPWNIDFGTDEQNCDANILLTLVLTIK